MDDHDPELAAAIALSLGLAPADDGGAKADDDDTQQTKRSADAQATESNKAKAEAPLSSRGGWLASPAPATSVSGPDVYIGRFSRRPLGNAWHAGSITLSVQGRLRWDNDAGVSVNGVVPQGVD